MSNAKKNLIYHRLQTAAHSLRKAADRSVLAASGLTTAQAAVLSIVESGEEVTQRQVAERLRLNESAMTAMVTRLIKLGFLKRRRSETDGRAWQLDVTEGGQAALKDLRGPFGEINAAVDDMLSEEEIKTLTRALDKITKRFGGG